MIEKNHIEPSFTLTSIRFSHYVEKVRWTLDRIGIAYTERSVLPVVHFFITPFVVASSGKRDSQSTRFSTPILSTDDGKAISKSSTIMRYLSDRFLPEQDSLYPSQEVIDLDEYYNETLGSGTRRVIYLYALQKPEIMFKLAENNAGTMQALVYKALYPFSRRLMTSALEINKQQADQDLKQIFQIFDDVEQQLSDGRPFLFGNKITAADISFACLGGILMLPTISEGYAAYLPSLDEVDPELARIANHLRKHKAGKWILKLFSEQRGKRLIPGKPLLSDLID